MNLVAHRRPIDEQEIAEIPVVLARWYAAHSSIRRLWALEDQETLIIFVALEPTSDGDDTLPVWLANNGDWATDLRSLVNREVLLKLLVADGLEESYVNSGAAVVAELNWRDAWISA